MYNIIIILVIAILLYLFFTRLFAVLLSTFCRYFFNIEFSIGKLGLLSVKNILITLKNGISIELDSIQLKSSLFTRNCMKPFTILVTDIRLNVDINVYKDTKTKSRNDIKNVTPPSNVGKVKKMVQNIFSYSILQHFAIQGKNVNVILLDAFIPNCLFSFSVQQIDLNVDKRLGFMLSVTSVSWKLLRHETKNPGSAPCLLEISYNLNLSVYAILKDEFQCQDVKLNLENPQITIHEDLFSMLPKTPGKSDTQDSTLNKKSSHLKFIPQNNDFNVNLLKLKIIRSDCQNVIMLDMKALKSALNWHPSEESVNNSVSNLNFQTTFEGILLAYSGYKIASLDKVILESKFGCEELKTDISVQMLVVSYSHLMDLSSLFALVSNSDSSHKQSTAVQKRNPIICYLSSLSHSLSVEVSDVQINMDMPNNVSPISCGFEYSKFTGNCTKTNTGEKSMFPFENFDFEFLLDTAWCALTEKDPFDPNSFKKLHRWNTPLVLGAMLIKVKMYNLCVTIQGLLDSVQVEWSPKLRDAVLCIARKRTFSNSESHKTDGKLKVLKVESCSISFSSINTFCVSDVGSKCAVLRIDSSSVKLNKSSQKTDVVVVGVSLSVVNSEEPFSCHKSSEVINSITYVENIEVHRTSQDINISTCESLFAKWNTTVHMVMVTLMEEVKEFLQQLKDLGLKPSRENSTTSTVQRHNINLMLTSKVKLFANLSSRNTITFEFDNAIMKTENGLKIDLEEAHIFLNQHDMLQLQNVAVQFLEPGHPLQRKRDFIDDFQLATNKSWMLNFDKIYLQFPYQVNFAEIVSGEAVNIIKWLKLVHKVKSTTENDLRADLVIHIKEANVEIKDDPFELKLRDNYELLEDEQKEWIKRKAILDDKIEAIRKSHLLLPAGKLEELYENLAKRNAELYIKRCNQVDKNYTKKATLCLWTSKDLEIFIATDPVFHGRENVIRKMQEIDHESPYPENGLSFSTLWCRVIHLTCQSMQVKLRDFPQSLVEVGDLLIWGTLIGAEQESSSRSKQIVSVELGEPWCNATLERGMQYLKFFHDLSCHVNYFKMAYGLCWEPVLSQLSQTMEYINRPSTDPSPLLTFWDKARLMYHGRLTLSVDKLSIMLLASLDPYNMTEEMEISWTSLYLDWTNAKFLLRGDMDILVHTASKYDDCRLVHLPGLKLIFKIAWLCFGHPNDHHSIIPCAENKIPEYSINQKHDSFRAFRSENLDLSITLETKQVSLETAEDVPSVLFYASTMRWFENLKMILSGVSRPTRRGALFNYIKPRKLQLSRHYKNIRLSFCLHKIAVYYWMSFAQERGYELHNGRLSLSSEQSLTLVKTEDGLIHRQSAIWSIGYMNCELNNAEIWLISSSKKEVQDAPNNISYDRSFFLNVSKVSYGREASFEQDLLTGQDLNYEGTPTHRLVIHNLRGSWTLKNRDLILALLDAYQKAQLLKRNLSTDALKSIKVDHNSVTPVKSRSMSAVSSGSTGTPSTPLLGTAAANTATPSPMSRLQSGLAANMLHKLISEADSNVTVYTEEMTDTTREQQLHGIAACQTDDVLHKNWLIELVNSQVMLKGTETPGYMIISAAKSQILQRVHRPVWRNRTLGSKTTWVGSLECMQYYATVDSGDLNLSGDNIMWLTLDNIEEKDSFIKTDVPDMVGSGQSVGGVVSDTVGVTDNTGLGAGTDMVQLQRIVSRCSCQFFYASYGEDVDPEGLQEAIPFPESTNLWDDVVVDSLTVVHHELNCSSNSQQYLMILDIINNLLLYTESKKKESYEQLQRMRFQLQLSSIEDQRKPILQLQNKVRMLVQKLRRIQKETYLIGKMLDDSFNSDSELSLQYDQFEEAVEECKEQLNAAGDELAVMISCFKETQLSAQQTLLRSASSKDQKHQLEAPAKRNEFCFRHAKWRLTEEDGQLGIADIVLANFLYTKVTKNDDSVEHLQELGYVKIENSLPNQVYKIALQPTELQGNIPLDRQRVLRVYCREKAPVGGISIKEHFEINVTPFTISVTHSFFKSMLKFFFPGRESEKSESGDDDSKQKKKRTAQLLRDSLSRRNRDDIEKMKERAEQNKLFLFIKIPEVPIRVSYKGEKEKNIQDINDFSLLLPTLEYHSVTWTWLDLLMTIKNDSKKFLLSQAIKQKLQIKVGRSGLEDAPIPQEEDKARMLFGSKLLGGVEKGTKKGLFGKHHK